MLSPTGWTRPDRASINLLAEPVAGRERTGQTPFPFQGTTCRCQQPAGSVLLNFRSATGHSKRMAREGGPVLDIVVLYFPFRGPAVF